MAEHIQGQPNGKRRVRSPAYPGVSLKNAMDKAKVVYKHEHAYEAAVGVVTGHWGYSLGAGPGNVALAALKHFGLLTEKGKGEDRMVKLSQLALDVIQDEIPDSEDRKRSIQKAALTPTIYKAMWDKWGSPLPSDATIRTFLVRERSFNPASVDGLISDYKETLSFAKLDEGCILTDDDCDKAGADGDAQKPGESPKVGDMPIIEQPKDGSYAVVRDLTIPLIGGSAAVLRIPIPLSEENFGLLTSILQTMKAAIVKDKNAPGSND